MAVNPKRIEAIEALGAKVVYDYEYVGEVGKGRHPVELLDVIVGVHLPLDPAQWCAIAQREGTAYVGGCCGNMGAVQDEMAGIFRDSGYAEAAGLLRMAPNARGHEGMEYFSEVDDAAFFQQIADINAAVERTKDDPTQIVDPWAIVGACFNAVEPALKPSWLDRPSVDDSEHSPIRAIRPAINRLAWAHLFEDGPRTDAKGGRILGQASHSAARLLDLAAIMQPTRDLLAYLESEKVEFEGFAIVKPGTEEVMSTYSGMCLYPTREDAQWVLDLWARPDEDEREGHGKVEGEIVSVHVSIPDGLVVRRP